MWPLVFCPSATSPIANLFTVGSVPAPSVEAAPPFKLAAKSFVLYPKAALLVVFAVTLPGPMFACTTPPTKAKQATYPLGPDPVYSEIELLKVPSSASMPPELRPDGIKVFSE